MNWQQAGLGLEHKALCAAAWLPPLRAVLVRPRASSASFWQEVPGTWGGECLGPQVRARGKGAVFKIEHLSALVSPKGQLLKETLLQPPKPGVASTMDGAVAVPE